MIKEIPDELNGAAFTHTHRGNPPLSNAKYIVTGWTEF